MDIDLVFEGERLGEVIGKTVVQLLSILDGLLTCNSRRERVSLRLEMT